MGLSNMKAYVWRYEWKYTLAINVNENTTEEEKPNDGLKF